MELLLGAETDSFGFKQYKITLMSHSVSPTASVSLGDRSSAGVQGVLGSTGWGPLCDFEALCRGSVPFLDSGVHVHIRTTEAVIGSASCDDPQLVNIDCTGWVA